MEVSWALLTLVILGLMVVLVRVMPRRSGPQAWPSWELVLSAQARDRRRYEDHETDLTDELGGLEATLRLARRESEQGDATEAARVLEAAVRHVARHVPTLRERLTLWRDAARVLSAIYPVPRLRVLAFQAWKLRGAAAGEGLARPALDAARRFSLRVYVLAYGLKVVLTGFRGTAQRAESDPQDVQRCLRRMEALGSDLGTLHGASLEVYKALLISLHARERS